ncbi:phage protein GemA/Gp16 family protein [Azonexus sp.]|uniref:phage protein GemA/Gp16 family protein n=1 Tax=Azonexus sp. TaxID=1872668 RepID=UPI0039E26A09
MSLAGHQQADRIRAIHAACRVLGIDDAARRAMQQQLTGKYSLREMGMTDLNTVLDHLNRGRKVAQAQQGGEWRFVFRLTAERQVVAKKIYRLAERVGPLLSPPVALASKAYIEGVTKQMRGTEQPLEFCSAEQLRKVVQALEMFVRRHEDEGAAAAQKAGAKEVNYG